MVENVTVPRWNRAAEGQVTQLVGLADKPQLGLVMLGELEVREESGSRQPQLKGCLPSTALLQPGSTSSVKSSLTVAPASARLGACRVTGGRSGRQGLACLFPGGLNLYTEKCLNVSFSLQCLWMGQDCCLQLETQRPELHSE